MVRQKRHCRNCPEKPTPVKPEPVVPASFLETESKRLWQQALMGCNSTVDMLENYATIGVPGAPVLQIQRLLGKLQTIISEVQRADSEPAK